MILSLELLYRQHFYLQNNDDDRTIVRRVFEDFAWFLHCLQSQDNVVGIIVRNHIL